MNFDSVFNTQKQTGKFPSFDRPKAIGYFSVNNENILSFDASQLKYYLSPSDKYVNFDLNRGINVRKKIEARESEKIDSILSWIQLNLQKLLCNSNDGQWIKPNFVSSRGVLTRIMMSPTHPIDDWIMRAAKFRETIYLCAFHTKKAENEIEKPYLYYKQTICWRKKFPQYLLSDDPNGEPDFQRFVSESEAFTVVFESRLESHSLLYSANISGVESNEKINEPLPIGDLKLVELRTSRIPSTSDFVQRMKRDKFCRWWCESFLIGLDNIPCGFRDDFGFVRVLKNYYVPDVEENSQEYWSGAGCMNFCNAFLDRVAEIVVDDYDKTIYKFEKIRNQHIIITEELPTSQNAFLPSWYTQ